MQLGHPIVISASHVCFDVMTWNIEHHGFTSNTASGAKSWTQTKNAAKSGYNESENELITRLTNVFRVIVDDSGRHSNSSMPGLMGFNEIGILAFDKMKTLIPGDNYKLFVSISDVCADVADDDGQFFKEAVVSGMSGLGHLSDFNEDADSSSPDVENLYGNVIAINTDIWGIVQHTTVEFPGSTTFRSNTALVTRLRYNGIQVPDVIWIHTHLKYNDNDKEKTLQIARIQSMVKSFRKEGLHNIIISGDLYIATGSTYLTSDIGFTKTHTHKTQIFSNPDDADQILVPVTADIELAQPIRLLGSMYDRTDLSDHVGVTCTLKLASNEFSLVPPLMDLNPTISTHRDDDKIGLDAAYKEQIRTLYTNMFGYVQHDPTWCIA